MEIYMSVAESNSKYYWRLLNLDVEGISNKYYFSDMFSRGIWQKGQLIRGSFEKLKNQHRSYLDIEVFILVKIFEFS
jgi:hypothetical protein